MFADAGVHPSAGHSPIEWHAAVEAATTRHDEIIRAVEASSTADEALEGARQSAAETHGALAAALEGDAAAATAALDDRDDATLCASGEARGRDSAALGAALVGARVCEFKLLATRARATQRAAASSAKDARRAL